MSYLITIYHLALTKCKNDIAHSSRISSSSWVVYGLSELNWKNEETKYYYININSNEFKAFRRSLGHVQVCINIYQPSLWHVPRQGQWHLLQMRMIQLMLTLICILIESSNCTQYKLHQFASPALFLKAKLERQRYKNSSVQNYIQYHNYIQNYKTI